MKERTPWSKKHRLRSSRRCEDGLFDTYKGGKDFSSNIPALVGLSESLIDSMYFQACTYLQYHNVDDAEKSFRLLCQIEPCVSEYWFGLARVLQEEDKYDQALSALYVAETIDSTQPEYYEEAISCCLHLRRVTEAQMLYRQMKKIFCCDKKNKEVQESLHRVREQIAVYVKKHKMHGDAV